MGGGGGAYIMEGGVITAGDAIFCFHVDWLITGGGL